MNAHALRLGRILAPLVGCAVALAGSLPARADDPAGVPRAFVEVEAPRATVFVGEVVRVRVRIGVEAAFVPARLVPLVRQRLDLPLHVEVPLLRGRAGLALVAGRSAGGDGAETVTLALNDATARVVRAADEVRDGVAHAVFHAERSLVFEVAGPVEVAAPTLRFAVATSFDDDLLHGRVPRDRRDVAVVGGPFRVQVEDVPVAGRPDGFGGAIGRFTVTAVADATAVEVGRAFRVTLRVAGAGNLARVAAPRLPPLAGFHVYGALDDAGPDVRTVVFEVAALRADVGAFPSIPFVYLDPTPPAGYRVVATAPLPLTFRGPDGATGREARPPRASSPSPRTTGAILVVLGAGVVAVVALGRRRAARRAAAADPARAGVAAAGVAAAIAAFHAAPAAGAAARLDPLVEVLAAHLRVPTAAVIAPGLASCLAAAGFTTDGAQATAALVEALVGARYGGAIPPDADARAVAAVATVEAVHRARALRGRRPAEG